MIALYTNDTHAYRGYYTLQALVQNMLCFTTIYLGNAIGAEVIALAIVEPRHIEMIALYTNDTHAYRGYNTLQALVQNMLCFTTIYMGNVIGAEVIALES